MQPGPVWLAIYWWRRVVTPDGELSASRLFVACMICFAIMVAGSHLRYPYSVLVPHIVGPIASICMFMMLLAFHKTAQRDEEARKERLQRERYIARAARQAQARQKL